MHLKVWLQAKVEKDRKEKEKAILDMKLERNQQRVTNFHKVRGRPNRAPRELPEDMCLHRDSPIEPQKTSVFEAQLNMIKERHNKSYKNAGLGGNHLYNKPKKDLISAANHHKMSVNEICNNMD